MYSEKEAYDIAAVFEQIENELIDDMMRNFSRHRAEELKEGYNWEQWQTLQLQALDEYRRKNLKKYEKRFDRTNEHIQSAIRNANKVGGADEEKRILAAIKKGYHASRQGSEHFFRVNEERVNALINAVDGDMRKAETAILRRANDEYRQIIFKTQMQAATGSVTYEKAVDLACKDFLEKGIQCVTYKNGAKHTIEDYCEMAMRTSMKRAYLAGEGAKRQEWGVHTVIVNHRNHACPKCVPFCGKVLLDDVYSGGTAQEAERLKVRTLSSAMAAGFLHPRCKDGYTTYFPGISDPPKAMTQQEKEYAEEQEAKEQAKKAEERKAKGYERRARFALDAETNEYYRNRLERLGKNVRFKTGDRDSKDYLDKITLEQAMAQRIDDFDPLPIDEVRDVLLNESRDWIANLNKKSRDAISRYAKNNEDEGRAITEKLFYRVNRMLEGSIPEDAGLRSFADAISEGLKKNRLQHDIICYRGMDIDPTKNLEIGELFFPKYFFSSSVEETNFYKHKRYKYKILVPEGSCGAYIETLSRYPGQREFLLDCNCVYRVLSRQGNTTYLEVLMHEG